MKIVKSIRRLLILIFVTISVMGVQSQAKKDYVINPGQKISDVVPNSDIYRYTDFKLGTVYFKDRRESNAPLNYNRLLNEFQFISTRSDTLSIADENLIKLIKVDNDTFYYNNGCYEQINSFNYLRLVRKEVISMTLVNKIGAYNQPVQGGSASSYTSYSLGGRKANLVINEKITLKKEVSHYFVDQEDHFKLASKKVLENAFPKYSSVIEDYVRQNSIDFKKETDLQRLLNYIKYYNL